MASRIWEASANFTRPSDTTAYADEDLVANSTTAGSVVPLTFGVPAREIRILQAKLLKSGGTPTNANFSLYLYKDSPTVTNGDNGAFVPTESNYIGVIALDMTTTESTNDNSITNTAAITSNLDKDQIVYGLLKAEAAYTPESAEVFTVTLSGEAY